MPPPADRIVNTTASRLAMVTLTVIALWVLSLTSVVVAQTSNDPAQRPVLSVPVPEPVNTDAFTLVEQTVFAAAGDPFVMVFDAPGLPPDATFELALHPPVTSRIQFGRTLEGGDLGAPVQVAAQVTPGELPTVEPGRYRIALTIATSFPGAAEDNNPFVLQATGPGVWPVVLSRSDQPDQPMITHVVVLEPPEATSIDRPTLNVGVMVGVTAPVVVATDGTSGINTFDVASIAATARAVTDSTVPVTVVPRPQTLQALATAGPEGLAALTDFAAPASSAAVPLGTWVPVDVASLTDGGLTSFVEQQRDAGALTIASTLGVGADGTTAILDATVDPVALDALVGLGVTQVVVPEALAEPVDSTSFPVTLTRSFDIETASGITVPALQTDDVASGLLRSSPQPALAANRALADLAVLAFDLPDLQRAVIIETDAGTADPAAVALLLAGLSQASNPSGDAEPLLGTVAVSDLFDTVSTATDPQTGDTLRRQWEFTGPEPLGDYRNRLANTQQRAATLSDTLQPGPQAPEAAATTNQVEQLILTSGLVSLEPSGRIGYLNDADDLAFSALAAIGVPDQGTITLTSDAGVIPVTLVNGRADPVVVQVELTSDKLEFPDGNTMAVELQPGTNRTEISVQTRASGAFPVQLDLRTADGGIVLGDVRFIVRSTAVSGIGLALSVLAGVFLVVWWGRHLKSARRSRQLIQLHATPPGHS